MNAVDIEPDIAGQFKAGMRRLASGVSLITSGTGARQAGLIATAVNSVSADPPTLLVCVNQTASAHDVIAETGSFCVNILPADCVDLAGQFSNSARRAERFQLGDWDVLKTGSPVLRAALVAFDCHVAQAIRYHSHTIFLGSIAAVRLRGEDLDPLLYLNSHFYHGASAQVLHP
jgi:flavin reductase